MGNVSIYLPEPLHDRVKELGSELNVSGICQGALEAEVNRREEHRRREQGMERIGVEVRDRTGDVTLWFVGKLLLDRAVDGAEEQVDIYRTKKGRYAAYWPEGRVLRDTDDLNGLADLGIDPTYLQEVAERMGEPRDFDIDI